MPNCTSAEPKGQQYAIHFKRTLNIDNKRWGAQ